MSLSGTFNHTAPPPCAAPVKPKREPPFSLRLSPSERARLAAEAAGAPLGAYIKAKLLNGAAPPVRVRRSGLPVEDRQALAQTLARLGASRLSANLNQIAFAANSGSLSLTPETNKLLTQALHDIAEIRRLLLVALGLKAEPGGSGMILKASQRSGGQDLATHLMNVSDNEHVLIHEVRGFASNNLKGAFKEAEAISCGTNCRQYLFSLSLSPPEHAAVSAAEFERTLSRVEDLLGLQGQPRAVVFHEKEGRRHAHCVWSRIDAETMTAKPMSFFKRKLVGISRDLYLEHGWDIPRGIAKAGNRNPTNFSLAEWQQAKRQGVDPRIIKEALQSVWTRSDNVASFAKGLEEWGYFLAKGDKRSFVVLGYDGEVHSLPKALGLKTKDVAARLGSCPWAWCRSCG